MRKWFLKHKDSIINGLISATIFYILSTIVSAIMSSLHIKWTAIWVSVWHYLSFEIPVYSILAFVVILWVVLKSKAYIKYKIGKNNLKIVYADYGSPDRKITITNELNASIIENKLNIVLSNNIAGDPHPGVRKKSKIIYKYNGEEHTTEADEDQIIKLP